MNQFKFFIILTILLFFGELSYAQCSDIYFYRVNSTFQSDKKVFLIQNGKTISRVGLGDRYKTTVCTSGEYEFVVKMKPDNITLSSKKIEVSEGQNYYLKLAASVGVEVASIKVVPPSKAEKEINKGSKFTSEIRTIQITQSANPVALPSSQAPNGTSTNTFLKSQTVDNFQFDIVDLKRMGDDIEFQYMITNKGGTDRILFLNGRSMMFYDDKSNFYTSTLDCIMDNCRDQQSLSKPAASTMQGKYYGGGGSHRQLIPYDIPIKASIRFSNVDKNATSFRRGDIILKSASSNGKNSKTFRLSYSNIPFPTDIDITNPNKRIVGSQTFEIVDATLESGELILQFVVENNSSEDYLFGVKNGILYDNLGSLSQLEKLAYFQKDGMGEVYRNQRTISAKQELPVFMKFGISNSLPTTAKRITIQFDDYELRWSDIEISNIGISEVNSSLDQDYITYQELETKIRNNENITGKKIVLEKIYFATGSDDLLVTSYVQLDELANLMAANGNVNVEISGHTDDVGDDTSNMLLSQKRADAVKYYLIGKSINPNRISSIGKGENEPINSNLTESGKQKNRRVEITVKE